MKQGLAHLSVEFNQNDEKRNQNQKVVEQGREWAPFYKGESRPILRFCAIFESYTPIVEGTQFHSIHNNGMHILYL
jgi:hypothetical protein